MSGKGGMYRYNDQVSFDLPKGYIHRTADDGNGNTREEICYGKGKDADGNESWEFNAAILTGTPDNLEGYTRKKNEKILDFYKRGIENSRFSEEPAAEDTAVYVIRRPIRVFGMFLKYKVVGIASVIDQDHVLLLQSAIQQDEDDPDPEISIFRHLTTVGNSIRINGKAMDFSRYDPKKLVKELKLSYDEENDESSVNLGLDVKIKNDDGEETDAGTVSISGMPEEGKKKVTAKKTGGKKKGAFVPIEQEGNRLNFGGYWSMELVGNCRLDRDPLEDESTGKQYVIKSGTREIWKFIIADDRNEQTLKSAAPEISQGVIAKLHDAQSIIDLELRSDESLKVTLHASIAPDGFSCAMAKVEIPDGTTYALTSFLPDIDDMQEALQKLNSGEPELFHPFGPGWEAQWTLMMRMIASVRCLDDPEPDDDNWVIGGYEYALNPATEIIPGVRSRIPKAAMKIDENTYVLTEFGLDKKQQVTGNSILTFSFIHSEREEPFDRQSSEPHNRLLVTHLGKGFASVLREKRTEGFHACLGYIPLGNGKFIISLMNDRLIAQIIIECGEQENHPIQFEAMECARKLFDSLSCGSMAEEAPAVFPPTPDFLHEHYDLVESGSYTTHRDADFTGQPIRMLLEKHGNKGEEAYELMKIKGDTYHLDQNAVSLAKVFRLDSSLFDPYGDAEALIRRGMFKDARSFEALRSLAWTVSCMADRSGRKIGEYSFEELKKIGEVIEGKNNLNYAAFSYMPGLCDHYDWHVFYVPDEYMRSNYQRSSDLRYLTGKENRGGNSISIFMPGILGSMNRVNDLIGRNEETLESLEALRYDLEALLPVMETIHDGLLADRNRSEKPEGVLADALTAWCALAVAAKEPFYSEEAADTPEADAGLEGPLERPTDALDDKPAKKTAAGKEAKPAAGKAAKPAKTAKPAVPAGDVLDLGGETVIKPGQFAANMTLKNIVIPEGVTEIGYKAFSDCLFLETVVFPKSLRKIDKFAFMSCRALRKVELQEGVEEIETHAFGATNSLKEVRLPDSLTTVDRTLFGLGGDSPYATAYMSGSLATRLMDEYNKGNSWPSDAIYARHFVIDGKGYENMTDFYKPAKQGQGAGTVSDGFVYIPDANNNKEYEKYISRDTDVQFSGKKFVFTGFDDDGNKENMPLVQEVLAKGGLLRKSVSGVTDYLVIRDLPSAGSGKLRDAAANIDAGKPVRIITEETLRAALDGKAKPASKAKETPKPAAGKPAAKPKAKTKETPKPAAAAREEEEALEEAKKIVGKMSEDMELTKSALDKHAEYLQQQEEEKKKRLEEAKAKGRSDKDEADMFAVLQIEEDLGCLDRTDDEFAETYAEDFAAYSPAQLIKLRKKVKPRMHDAAFAGSVKEEMLSRSVKDRFGISTANWFNLANEWDFDTKGENAIEKTRQWYRDGELAEVRKLMNEHKQGGIDSVNRQLTGFNGSWNCFAGVKGDLHINIEACTDPIPEKHNLFDVMIEGNHHVQILLKHPSMGFLTIPVMNLFASVWKTTPEKIWDAAMANSMDDSRNVPPARTRTDAGKAKDKALAMLKKTAPSSAPKPAAVQRPAAPARNNAYAGTESDPAKEHQRNALNNRIRALEQERDSLTGLFAGFRRKRLQNEIDDLKDQLRRL